MSDQDATREAERRGLRCRSDGCGFLVLANSVGRMVARGSTWEEAFGRLEPMAAPMPPEFATACPKCRAGIGEKCRNYKRQNKQTCPARLKPAETKAPPAETIATAGKTRPTQRGLFDNL